MQGKDSWNIITHNAKRMTSSIEFPFGGAGDLLQSIGRIFIFL